MSKGHRHWCFTLNNYTEDELSRLSTLNCRFITYGREVAPDTQTPHLQGFVSFRDSRTLSAVKKDVPRAHLEPKSANSTFDQAIGYCSKTDSNPYVRGDRPQDSVAKGDNERQRWTDALSAAKAGRWDDVPADIYIRNYSNLKRIKRDSAPAATDLVELDHYGLWIYGPPRTGKSHMARTQYAPVYLKDLNKWWDDYDGEANVLIDEFGPDNAKYLTDYMKKWVDRWKFSAEMKGSRTVIRPQLIIVTSNYSIEDCFTGVDRDAMLSRFRVIHKLQRQDGED